ncbi:MAG: Lrp/AsnC ligand binding domain-containing protein [Chloroflexi bacterium]|nr:Lrp/AsnC ligand binding domain-containing protein [Chloroflexota bacterium]
MVTAYLLVKLEGGTKVGNLEHVRSRPEVSDVHFVFGPYDAIVRCEVSDLDALGELAKAVRSCPGISESLTCVALD